jgi:ParB family transcriptional regulator, chromosome partitioning protein
MSASPEIALPVLQLLNVTDIMPNERNPRLDFPQDELDRLAESIDQEGILVPIVVYPKGDRFILVDGERRFRCAKELALEQVPGLVTSEKSEREILQQMFNIHLIREPWRDIPTAKALQRLVADIEADEGHDPSDKELRELTGLSIERVRQLRYVVTLPEEWQAYIREGTIPLNFFWELKKNVIDALSSRRPSLLAELEEERVGTAFVQKRLSGVITDTVSLRKVAPIIKFAQQDAEASGTDTSTIDASIRDLVQRPEATIDEAYEETVQMMVEVDKLARRTNAMVSAFRRLLAQSQVETDRDTVVQIGRDLIRELDLLFEVDEKQRQERDS